MYNVCGIDLKIIYLYLFLDLLLIFSGIAWIDKHDIEKSQQMAEH